MSEIASNPVSVRRQYQSGEIAKPVNSGKLWGDLVDGGASPHELAVITPRNVGGDGTETLNRDIRLALGFGPAPQVGDLLIVTKNNYRALAAPDHCENGEEDETGRVAIFNGERCEIIRVEGDIIDALFPGSRTTAERRARFLANGDRPPEGTAFGYAMTAHKAQGSQFKFVVLVTARPDRFVSKASIYTAASRARERLFIVGDEGEFVDSVGRLKPPRRTLLSPNVVF
jgi:ATP-dependent exoDNAse (exonuclease V) alpha subunit